MGIIEDYRDPVMIEKPNSKLKNDNNQTNDIVESGEYHIGEPEEYGDLSVLGIGIKSVLFAVFGYIVSKYIVYDFIGASILEYISYFFMIIGIIYVVIGILGKMIGFINKPIKQ